VRPEIHDEKAVNPFHGWIVIQSSVFAVTIKHLGLALCYRVLKKLIILLF